MTAVWVRAMKELRARWRAWLAIALMVGIAGGVVMAAAAGARRTDSAVPRFLAYAQATTAFVGPVDPSAAPAVVPLFPTLARLPQVESATALARLLSADTTSHSGATPVSVLAFMTPGLNSRPILAAGKLFDPSDAGQAMINESALRSRALRIGQVISLRAFTPQQLRTAVGGAQIEPAGPSATVTVVGVIKLPTDLTTSNPPSGVLYTGNDDLFLTPALYQRVGGKAAQFPGLVVRLRKGDADIPSFTKAVMTLTHGQAFVAGGSDDLQAGIEAQRATHAEAIALWLFTSLAGAAAILVIGQSAARQIFLGSDDNATLLAMGMSRPQLALSALLPVLFAAALGAVVAISIAVLLSPLAPIGLARSAETDIGFHLDLPVVLLGAVGCIVLMLAPVAVPSWRVSRKTGGEIGRHPSRTADALARGGMPASSVAGVRMALDPGRGRNAVPIRTAIAGTVVATAVLMTALAFGASLTRLANTPQLQGWTWDVAVGNPHGDDAAATAIPLLHRNPAVAGFSSDVFGSIALDRHAEVVGLGIDRIVGDVGPPILEGRAPTQLDEIALASKALRVAKKHVGETVEVSPPGDTVHSRTMRIVGRVLITPIIVNGQMTLGDGALMTVPALRQFVPPQESDEGAVNVFLVKLAPDVDRKAALTSLQRDFPGTVLTPYAAAEVENLRRIDTLPYVLAGLLGLLAAATIAHALVTSVRRRRRDLAILKTLGFVRPQVRATVAWQASTLSAISAGVGLVAGILGGRWLWIFFANGLGIRPEPAIPLLLIVVVIPAALLLGNLIAAIPARAAARTEPALVLRTE
jgi:putative ABC transport system permease protein